MARRVHEHVRVRPARLRGRGGLLAVGPTRAEEVDGTVVAHLPAGDAKREAAALRLDGAAERFEQPRAQPVIVEERTRFARARLAERDDGRIEAGEDPL